MVECAYPSDSTATGFQMIVHQSNAHRLYVNKTADRQIPASVVVEGKGLYQVTIFAIREGSGIVDSGVEYINLLMVGDVSTTTTPTTTTTTFTADGKIHC